MTWFAVPKRGGAPMRVYFAGDKCVFDNRSMSMTSALNTYRFEGYLGCGLGYPGEMAPDKIVV